MSRKVGAPKGGRVHWLLWHLSKEFKKAYQLNFHYLHHNYAFYRMRGRKLYDVFLVVQTSKHYWHVTYFCDGKQKFEYFGYRNTRMIAIIMEEIWQDTDFSE